MISVNFDGEKERWDTLDVYIRDYSSGDKNIIYNFVHKEVQVKIITSHIIKKDEVQEIVEKAIWG